MLQQSGLPTVMKNNAVAIRHPLALALLCGPYRCDGCVGPVVVELFEQDAVAFLGSFLMLIIELLPNAVNPIVQRGERAKGASLGRCSIRYRDHSSA
ncbi:MAG: hypothetical protein SO120_06740 [Prevotella sp.]|nr:hypothetical protein [Prevotella sp.]